MHGEFKNKYGLFLLMMPILSHNLAVIWPCQVSGAF